ncbi:hypothetical protein B0J11DRAFT_542899 [Dendryphion nanum]|uniref:BHLH domain-containing protein n=1 Tax=Dendryphion nanum TaxID=256645 RepID=A0A9P9D3H2_9PLEO|nr:hypothetical protein B0J11DRAFT_542899 [Dendryphion nanum]
MDTNLSVYPEFADTDCASTNELFSWQNSLDQNYLANLYSAQLDQPLDYHAAFYSAPALGQMKQRLTSNFDTAFTFEPSIPITPTTGGSSAPIFCSDGILTLATPPLSPSSPDRDAPNKANLPGEEQTPKRPQCKHGRPTLDRKLSDTVAVPSIDNPSSTHPQRTLPIPHNQVERKYREGLNSEMERLRCTVPVLSQNEMDAVIGRPKPSKAMVLSCAIKYIKEIEHDRNGLREMIRQLNGDSGGK